MARPSRPITQQRPLILFVLSVAMASALVASQAVAWVGVRRAAKTLEEGEVQRSLTLAQQHLLRLERRPTRAELRAVLHELGEDRVRWIGLRDPEGALDAGEPSVGWRASLPPPGVEQRYGSRVRASARLSPPQRALPGPPHPMGPPQLVVEVEPHTSREVEQLAAWTLTIGSVTALLFIVTALAMRRAVLDRELALIRQERSRHLASLGEMSAILAHEIRNPLASLKGNAQLLEEALADGTRERRKAAVVVREAERIEKLVTGLLDFVRKGRMQLREVALGDFVRPIVETVDAKRLALESVNAPEKVSIDPERLGQAVENILRNALQASPTGAEVRVEGTERGWRLTVRDHGEGIAPEVAVRLFEPFRTTKTRGTGLGLAITRRIVEGHGGTIRGYNHAGGGAVFEMEIPRDGR
jgi:two-component system sensor histidine kinase HydH